MVVLRDEHWHSTQKRQFSGSVAALCLGALSFRTILIGLGIDREALPQGLRYDARMAVIRRLLHAAVRIAQPERIEERQRARERPFRTRAQPARLASARALAPPRARALAEGGLRVRRREARGVRVRGVELPPARARVRGAPLDDAVPGAARAQPQALGAARGRLVGPDVSAAAAAAPIPPAERAAGEEQDGDADDDRGDDLHHGPACARVGGCVTSGGGGEGRDALFEALWASRGEGPEMELKARLQPSARVRLLLVQSGLWSSAHSAGGQGRRAPPSVLLMGDGALRAASLWRWVN